MFTPGIALHFSIPSSCPVARATEGNDACSCHGLTSRGRSIALVPRGELVFFSFPVCCPLSLPLSPALLQPTPWMSVVQQTRFPATYLGISCATPFRLVRLYRLRPPRRPRRLQNEPERNHGNAAQTERQNQNSIQANPIRSSTWRARC